MKKIVAFVGENGNGILERQSRRFSELLKRPNVTTQVLRCHDDDFLPQLKSVLEGDRILFGWGYAGVGARLTFGGRNLWDTLEVPFISVLADPPYAKPDNHAVPSAYVVNGYIYRDWLDLQRSHFQSPQVSTLLPMGVIPNLERSAIRWSDRPIRMLFVKSGSDPGKQRAQWSSTWPTQLRSVLYDCADALAAMGTCSILPTVEACLAAHNLYLEGQKTILFGLLHELDNYMRALRATRMVEAMVALPVDIIGDGWEHLSNVGGQARFHNAIDARDLDSLYAKTQILVNTTPNFGGGAHERVLRGFAARCCVLSDNNDHARKHFQGLPNYFGVEWQSPDLADHIAESFHDPRPYDGRLDEAQAYVERHHCPSAFLTSMIDTAQMALMTKATSPYALNVA